MPLKNGRLTKREKLFADAMARTGDRAYSATLAGYSSPESQGQHLAARLDPEITARVNARLNNVAAPIAVDVLIDVALDERQPGATRVAAADKILKHARGEGQQAGKEAYEMTQEELTREIQRLKREQSERAKNVIEHDPAPGLFD